MTPSDRKVISQMTRSSAAMVELVQADAAAVAPTSLLTGAGLRKVP
jgi:hypothetical protein